MADEVYGLQIKHPVSGAILLTITDRITRVIGTRSTGVSSGSITVDDGLGDPFFMCLNFGSYGPGTANAAFSVSGRTCSWTFGNTPVNQRVPVTVVYGVY